ncbi:hypothetical protein Fcan01_16476 [Folsomia candida]|uniref:Uncharacterized protein n=1 Tax=Folsomia candida TaxID=158441 RepID=A0A226DTP9_FOLCA|nr:hypothetical protein Fcan01_16476 [Folsomia candida]
MNPPKNLVAKWKFISKLNNNFSNFLRIAAPSVLVLLMVIEAGMKPFLGCGWNDSSSKVGFVFLLVVQGCAIFCLAGSLTCFMFTVLFESLHCVIEHLSYLKRSDDPLRGTRLTISLQIYNQLQIFVAQINLCLRKVSLPTTVVGVIVSNILGLSLTILLGARLLDHIGNLFLPMATTLSTMFTIVLGTSYCEDGEACGGKGYQVVYPNED